LEDWEQKLLTNFEKLKEWEKQYVKNVKNEIKNLIKEKNSLIEKLDNVKDLSERYSIYWELKEHFDQLKLKFTILQTWSRTDFSIEIDNFLCREIYFFEKCFSMLKAKHGAAKVDLRHFLSAVQLEYEYFIEKQKDLPLEFLKAGFELEGYTEDPKLNLINNNIINAQKNLKNILKYKEREKNHKELFLYYEVLGDLYIHLYLLLREFEEEKRDNVRKNLFFAYCYYNKSFNNKTIIQREDPYTGYDGLHGWPCLKIFVKFYEPIGVVNIHNVKLKIKYLQNNLLEKDEIKEIHEKLRGDLSEF